MAAYSSIPINKRVDIVDFLRGFALLGIFISNIAEYAAEYSLPTPPTDLSAGVTGFVKAFIEGSFYPLFSFLFGIGFAVWMDKSMKKNSSVWLFAWRSCVLFFLGYAFFILIASNNVLLRYSLLSIPLLLFYKVTPKVLLTAAFVFLLLGVLHQPISQQFRSMRNPEAQARIQSQIKKDVQAYQAARKEAEKEKKFSSFVEARSILFSNQLKMVYTLYDRTLPMIFSMFLFGMFCWRRGLFTAVEKNIPIWKRIYWIGLIVGAGGQLFIFFCRLFEYKKVITPNQDMLNYAELILNPTLTFFYISLFVLAVHKLKGKKNIIVDALKATGRMALTNFFIQYIIIAALMYPYGFGLKEKLFSHHLVLAALSIFSLQVIFSVFWLKHFVYGPMEWLWRSLTYMNLQSIRKEDKHHNNDSVPSVIKVVENTNAQQQL